jgi:hypothetical protein
MRAAMRQSWFGIDAKMVPAKDTYLSLSELPPHNPLQHNSQSISSTDFPLLRFRHLSEDAEQRRHILADMGLVPFVGPASPVIAQHQERIGCTQYMLEKISIRVGHSNALITLAFFLILYISLRKAKFPAIFEMQGHFPLNMQHDPG